MIRTSRRFVFRAALSVTVFLLVGCSGMSPRPMFIEPVQQSTTQHGQCDRPRLPNLIGTDTSAWNWLVFSQHSPLLDWVAQPAHPGDLDLALAWGLYFSQPGQSPLLLQLGTGQLQQLKPSLPDTLQPLIDLHLTTGQALLAEHRQGAQQQLSLQTKIRALELALTQKQSQIDALTAIESQLNVRDTTTAQEDTP